MARRFESILRWLALTLACASACSGGGGTNDGPRDGSAGDDAGGSAGSLSAGGSSGSGGNDSGGSAGDVADSGGDAGSSPSAGGAGTGDTGSAAGGSSTSGTSAGGVGATATGGTDGGTTAGGSGGSGSGGSGSGGSGSGGSGSGGSGSGGGGSGGGGHDDMDGLPDALDLAGVVQEVTEANGQTLTFTPPAGSDGTDMVVLFAPPDSTEWTPVPASVEGALVSVVADDPGTYVPARVDTTPPEGCSEATWEGDVEANTDLGLSELEGYTRVDGDLRLGGTFSDLSPLRCLTEITGDLLIFDLGLPAIKFPNLVRVRGDVLYSTYYEGFTFAAPRLRLTGALRFDSVPNLTAVNLNGLIYVHRNLRISYVSDAAEHPLALDFASLVSVGSGFALQDVHTLENLDGFSALQTVADAEVDNCAALENADGLSTLAAASSISFTDNPALASVALPALTQLQGSHISGSPVLTSIQLNALEEVTEFHLFDVGEAAAEPLDLGLSSLHTLWALSFGDVANLETLEGLSALETVTGGIDVYSFDAPSLLRDASGLESLVSAGNIWFSNLAKMEAISLPSLTTVGGSLYAGLDFERLPKLTTIELDALTELGGLSLDDVGHAANGDLTVALPALETIQGDLSVQAASNLVTVDGFTDLTAITGYLRISGNENLVGALEFPNLESVGGVSISSNPKLTSLSFEALTEVGDYEALRVSDLPELTQLKVSQLERALGWVQLANLGQPSNADLTLEFTKLRYMGSGLIISSVHNLASVDGFSELFEIAGYLEVSDNPDLVSFSGFDNLMSVWGDLHIQGNEYLSECLPLDLLERLQTEGEFLGAANISDNMPDTCD